MRKTVILLITVVLMLLCACNARKEVGDLKNYTSGDTGQYVYVALNGKIFVPFTAVSNADRGKQIGIVNGDPKDQIYEYKDYPTDEWIISYYESGEMDGSMLMKEESISEFPEGLESEYEWNRFVTEESCTSEYPDSTTIIGGADGPTSIFLAPKISSKEEKAHDNSEIDDSEYTSVIDRVLNEYNFEPVGWDNTIEWSEDADVLINMAEENKGRYKAYGIISKEAGAYGIVLIDTVDWTEINTNYVYEKWFYTGNSDGKPELWWDKSRLYFTYPVPSGDGYVMKTVKIDCGYDTGHMEIVETE